MKVLERVDSSDGATKYLFELNDGHRIESVFLVMDHDEKDSICISSQVGCALSCRFCSTGLLGLSRDLTPEEIAEQVYLAFQDQEFTAHRRFDVSFMGMGEPLMNLDSVLAAKQLLKQSFPDFNFYLSTVGIVPALDRLVELDPDFGLQISLHAPTDDLRTSVMAINRAHSIEDVLAAGARYAAVATRPVTLNYCMMAGVNDSVEHATQLAELVQGRPFRVQLVNFNPHISIGFEPTTEQAIAQFINVLRTGEIPVHYGRQLGKLEGAGCGQLDADYQRGALKGARARTIPLEDVSVTGK